VEHGFLPNVWGTIGGVVSWRPGLILERNLVIGGIRARQIRAETASLNCKVTSGIQAWYKIPCRSEEPASGTFGLAASANQTLVDSIPATAKQAYSESRVTKGVGAYDAIFDVERPLSDAFETATFLRRNDWLSEATRSLELQALLLNAEGGVFALLNVGFTFQFDGKVHTRVTTAVFSAQAADRGLQDYAAEMAWVILIFILFQQEFIEFGKHAYNRELKGYLLDFWNILDWISICIGLAIIVYQFWIEDAVAVLVEGISDLPRAPLPLNLDSNGYQDSYSKLISDALDIHFLFGYLQLCIFWYTTVITGRFLKGCLGQPKLAMIQTTITKGFWDVLHFMLVFLILFNNFVVGGKILFGNELMDWSSYPRAVITTFMILMGSPKFDDMYAIGPVSATVWFWLFYMSMVWLLMNILLCICIEYFSATRHAVGGQTPTILADIKLAYKEWKWRMEWRRDQWREGEYKACFIGSPYAELQEGLFENIKADDHLIAEANANCLGLRLHRRKKEDASVEGVGNDASPGSVPVSSLELRRLGCDALTAEHLIEDCTSFVEETNAQKQTTRVDDVRHFVNLLRASKQRLEVQCQSMEDGIIDDQTALEECLDRLEDSMREAVQGFQELRMTGVDSLAPPISGQGGDMKAALPGMLLAARELRDRQEMQEHSPQKTHMEQTAPGFWLYGRSSSPSSSGGHALSGGPSSRSLPETAEIGSFAKVSRRIMNAGQSLADDAVVSPTPSASAAPWASAIPHGQSAPRATASVSYAAFVSSIDARGGRADPKTLPGSEETSSWAPSSPPQVSSSGSNQPSSILPLRSPSPPQAEGAAGAFRTPTSMSLMFLKRKEDAKMKMEEMFVKMKEEDLEAKRRKLNQKFEDEKAAPSSTPIQADTSGASECPTPPAVHCSTMDDVYEFASTCPNARKALKWMGVTSVLDLACTFSSEADLRLKLQQRDEAEDIVCDVIRTWKLARTNEEHLIESASTRLQTRASRSVRPEPASVVSLRKTRKGLYGPPELDNRLSRTTVLPLSKAAVVQNDCREEHLSLIWSLFVELGDKGLRRSAAVLEDADAAKPGFMRIFREFDEGQLRSKLSVLKRWQRWYEARQPGDQPYWLPSANAVSAFLATDSEGGPTASSGVYQGLLWWPTYVGIPFHLSDPSVCSFKTKDAGHSEEPVPPIDVMTFDRMLSLSLALQGSISIFAGFVILMLSACLRFAHLQRSTLLHIQDGCLVGTCSRGKRRVAGVRPPFDWATPLMIQPGRNPFAQILLVHGELRQRMGREPAFAIPDTVIVNGRLSASSAILPKPMSLPKFTEIFQSLLRGFQLPEKEILSFASYSLRRFLPTLADIFMMEPEQRAAIGNWIETPHSSAASSGSSARPKAQLTMAQRYSQDKCITAGYVKQRALVMLSMAHSELKITGATWSQLRTVAPAYDDVTREMRRPAWRPEEKPAGEAAAAEAVEEDTVFGATSSNVWRNTGLWFPGVGTQPLWVLA
ncbi:unnamed protein product, partial [Polarella glacialis]